MKYILAVSFIIFALLETASAQVRPDEQTERLVQNVTKALFDLLPHNDFEAERAFMTDDFAAATSLSDWKMVREYVIQNVGITPEYTPYQVTYYEQDNLLAAVDFYGESAVPDTFVCGFILWEIIDQNEIGFIRFEQTIVSGAVVKSMPAWKAAQLMTNWRCPAALIEAVLGISLQ